MRRAAAGCKDHAVAAKGGPQCTLGVYGFLGEEKASENNLVIIKENNKNELKVELECKFYHE